MLLAGYVTLTYSGPFVIELFGTVHVGTEETEPDIAVLDVKTMKNGCFPMPVAAQGFNLSVYITVENQGPKLDCFIFKVFANSSWVNTTYIILDSGQRLNFCVKWDTTYFLKGLYTICCNATPVEGETDLEDNSFSDTVLLSIESDTNGDHIVDISDLVRVVNATASIPGDPNWDTNADVYYWYGGEWKVDVSDLTLCVSSIPSGPW